MPEVKIARLIKNVNQKYTYFFLVGGYMNIALFQLSCPCDLTCWPWV